MKIFSEELVARAAQELHIANLSTATIGEVLLMAQYLERETGIPFIRMDQGSPGLPINRYGVEAEKAALDRGVYCRCLARLYRAVVFKGSAFEKIVHVFLLFQQPLCHFVCTSLSFRFKNVSSQYNS